MSDLFGNHIVGFPTRRLICLDSYSNYTVPGQASQKQVTSAKCTLFCHKLTIEPPRGKTNNVISEQVRHKPVCAATESGWKLEILDLRRRGSVLSM